MDSIVVLVHPATQSGHYRLFELTVRRRPLLEFSNVQPQAGAAGSVTGTGLGTDVGVPREKWGLNITRIFEHDSFRIMCVGSVACERHSTARQTHITIRDYNPFWVQRALRLFGGTEQVTLESKSVVKVVKEPSVHRGGEWFRDNIETGLPYVETVAPYDSDGYNKIIMNKDNLVVVPQLVRTERMEVGRVNVHAASG